MKKDKILTKVGFRYDPPLSTGVIISRHGVEVVAGPIAPDLMLKYQRESNNMQIEHIEEKARHDKVHDEIFHSTPWWRKIFSRKGNRV